MSNVLLSIIVPVYKVEKYLDNCVCSVLNQTFTNYEIILVDDGSPDMCPQMCDKWALKDSRIRVLHKKNGGLSSARNAGIKVAIGEYLYFLDSDDKLYDIKSLDSLWNLIQYHGGVDMVQGNFYIEENNGVTFREDSFPVYSENNKWIKSHLATMVIPESACNRLIKRSIIVDNNLYFKEGWIQEDTLWSYQIHNHIKSIAFCFIPTYFYAYNSSSIMHSSGNEKEALAFVNIFNEVYSNLLTQRKYTYNIKFLEIMASRAEKAVGVDILPRFKPYNNQLFRSVFKLNSLANNTNNRILKYSSKLIVLTLRYLLCNEYFFRSNK